MEEKRRKATLEKCLEKTGELTALINETAGCQVFNIGGIKAQAPDHGSVEFCVCFDFTSGYRPG
jgi:hypothetical protein